MDAEKPGDVSPVGKKVVRMVWSVVVIVVCVYIGLACTMMLFQKRLIYFPERHITATPETAGLEYESVEFEAADGVSLHGWYVPAEPSRGTVLFCHGNAGNISHRLDSIRLFHQLGLSTFIFDYRGYGESGGRTTEQGTYRDAEAAWRYLVETRGTNSTQIVMLGRSLGGAIAAWLAQEHTPRALILESTFTSVPDLAAKLYPIFPVRLMARFEYNALEYLGRVKCPVLIVHSRDDEIIPFSHGQRLFAAAHEPKEFLEIRGSHNEGFFLSATQYREGLDAFISKHSALTLNQGG